MEKANEYAVDSLKQIMTLASAVLALTITFLKDVLGENRDQAIWVLLVPLGWLFLILSIVLAWLTIVDAADDLGTVIAPAPVPYLFGSEKIGAERNLFVRMLSWFMPGLINVREQNKRRRLAASAQNYFILGLFFLSLFAILNLFIPSHKTKPPPIADISQQTPSTQSPPRSENPGFESTSIVKINNNSFVVVDSHKMTLWLIEGPLQPRSARRPLQHWNRQRNNRVSATQKIRGVGRPQLRLVDTQQLP
jgi:hypothetical protein